MIIIIITKINHNNNNNNNNDKNNNKSLLSLLLLLSLFISIILRQLSTRLHTSSGIDPKLGILFAVKVSKSASATIIRLEQ
jgi:hypothetical protein